MDDDAALSVEEPRYYSSLWNRVVTLFSCVNPFASKIEPDAYSAIADEDPETVTWYFNKNPHVAHRKRGCLGATNIRRGSVFDIGYCCNVCCPFGFTLVSQTWPGYTTSAFLFLRMREYDRYLCFTENNRGSLLGGFIDSYKGASVEGTRESLKQWIHQQLRPKVANIVCDSLNEEPTFYAVFDVRDVKSEIAAVWIMDIRDNTLLTALHEDMKHFKGGLTFSGPVSMNSLHSFLVSLSKEIANVTEEDYTSLPPPATQIFHFTTVK